MNKYENYNEPSLNGDNREVNTESAHETAKDVNSLKKMQENAEGIGLTTLAENLSENEGGREEKQKQREKYLSEKIKGIITEIYDYRDNIREKLAKGKKITPGDVLSRRIEDSSPQVREALRKVLGVEGEKPYYEEYIPDKSRDNERHASRRYVTNVEGLVYHITQKEVKNNEGEWTPGKSKYSLVEKLLGTLKDYTEGYYTIEWDGPEEEEEKERIKKFRETQETQVSND
jgi:hypothetical protein